MFLEIFHVQSVGYGYIDCICPISSNKILICTGTIMDRMVVREKFKRKQSQSISTLLRLFAKDTNTILILRRNITAAIFDLHKITAACVFYDHIRYTRLYLDHAAR